MGKNKKKFNHLPDPEIYNSYDFISINGATKRKYIYNNHKRCDVFGRTSEKDLWSNPYTAWQKFNTSGHLPIGCQATNTNTIRCYNSISYNNNINYPTNKNNRKKIIPNNTLGSSHNLSNNLKIEQAKYLNDIRNRKMKTQISPQCNYYPSPTKYTRDYFGSTLYKGTESNYPTIMDLEKQVSSQYWIPKKELLHSQGHGMKVYQKSANTNLNDWYKYYPALPLNYYTYSFL
jgi:hypothetical protein